MENKNLFIKGIRIDWSNEQLDHYLHKISILKNTSYFSFEKPITFFVGENGSGKSTLLEAIALSYGFNGEGGTINYNFKTNDTCSNLYRATTIIKGSRRPHCNYFLRAESFYNVATKENEYSQIGGHPLYLHYKSHGESFLTVVQNSFGSNGLFIMDEPEAALSPQKQLTLLLEIKNCIESGGQFIIATHSPILLGFPDADIISFDADSLTKIDYKETESYKVTSLFINNREYMLDKLLKNDE